MPPEVAAHHPLPKVLRAGRGSLGRWGRWRGGVRRVSKGFGGCWVRQGLGHTLCPVPMARCCSEQAPRVTPLLQDPSQAASPPHPAGAITPRWEPQDRHHPNPAAPHAPCPGTGQCEGTESPGPLPEAVGGGQEGRAPAGAAAAAAPREAPALRAAAAGQPQGRHCRGGRDLAAWGSRGYLVHRWERAVCRHSVNRCSSWHQHCTQVPP